MTVVLRALRLEVVSCCRVLSGVVGRPDRGARTAVGVSETGEFAVSLCGFFFSEVVVGSAGLFHQVDELRRE